ncbi:MAG: prenyltransferase [Firmicutes bacterium]|nr:prenyltransferase [Bacillota bacterium]
MKTKWSARIYFSAVRGPFVTASVLPVLVGTAMAFGHGLPLNGRYFLLNLLGVVALHFGANAANDYFDYLSGADPARPVKPFSGGSGLLQKGVLGPMDYTLLIWGHFALAMLIALYFGLKRGVLVTLLGLLGLVAGYCYTAPPVRLSYRGLGEATIGLVFGPLAILGSYAVQGGTFSQAALLASLPLGFLIANVLLVNEFADHAEDKEAGKRNLVVRLGPRHALPGTFVFFLSAYLSILTAVALSACPFVSLSGCLTLPLALWAVRQVQLGLGEPRRLTAASAATIIVHGLTGLLLALSFILS